MTSYRQRILELLSGLAVFTLFGCSSSGGNLGFIITPNPFHITLTPGGAAVNVDLSSGSSSAHQIAWEVSDSSGRLLSKSYVGNSPSGPLAFSPEFGVDPFLNHQVSIRAVSGVTPGDYDVEFIQSVGEGAPSEATGSLKVHIVAGTGLQPNEPPLGAITVMDGTSSSIVGWLPAPYDSLVVSTDGSRIYAADNGDAAIIDAATYNVTPVTLPGFAAPSGPVLLDPGRALYVSAGVQGLFQITLPGMTANKVTGLPAAVTDMAISRTRGELYASLPSSGDVAVVNTSTLAVRTFHVGGQSRGPRGLAVTPSGRLLVAGAASSTNPADGFGFGLVSVDPASGTIVGHMDDSGMPNQIVFAPTGDRAYVSLVGGGVILVDISADTPRPLAIFRSLPGETRDLAISSDGSLLFAVVYDGSKFRLYRLITDVGIHDATVVAGFEQREVFGVAINPASGTLYVGSLPTATPRGTRPVAPSLPARPAIRRSRR